MPRDRRDTPHVVDVAVRHQDRRGPQAVCSDDLGDSGRRILAGVDDDALLARAGGDDVAVRAPRPGRERSDEHEGPFGRVVSWTAY